MIDRTSLGTVLFSAAAEAMLQSRRLAIVRVFARDVTTMGPLAILHGVGTHYQTSVAVRS